VRSGLSSQLHPYIVNKTWFLSCDRILKQPIYVAGFSTSQNRVAPDAGCEEMGALNQASISGQNQSEQGFQETSRTGQEHLTNSSNEFVRCISDTLNEILQVEETAHAPLGGASPQIVESVEELEEELPAVTECTTLAFVEAAQDESALLLAENQDCGVEPRNCHEGTFSAALVAQNEFSSKEAIANQTPGLVEQGYSVLLPGKNQVSGVEIKAVHEGESSAPPVSQTEKWSHEAIVARSNMRQSRMQKLKVAANSGQNPGLGFLQECWNDDPALVIVIKKLLVKFPQWGVAIVDGALVDWER
jgi:hypothetical protein